MLVKKATHRLIMCLLEGPQLPKCPRRTPTNFSICTEERKESQNRGRAGRLTSWPIAQDCPLLLPPVHPQLGSIGGPSEIRRATTESGVLRSSPQRGGQVPTASVAFAASRYSVFFLAFVQSLQWPLKPSICNDCL